MIDILQLLIQVLNIDCSIVTCTYPTVWETLFYVIFFPSVFILLFVYALSETLAGKLGVPFRLLLAAAVYIYIVLQGFFTFFVSLSGLWLFLIILIGFIWFVFRHIFGKGEGGKMPAVGGGLAAPLRYAVKKTVKGQTKYEKRIEDRLSNLRSAARTVKTPPPGTDVGLARREYAAAKMEAENAIEQFENLIRGSGVPGSGELAEKLSEKYWKEITRISKDVEGK